MFKIYKHKKISVSKRPEQKTFLQLYQRLFLFIQRTHSTILAEDEVKLQGQDSLT